MAVTSLPATPPQIMPLMAVCEQCYRMAGVTLAAGRGLGGSQQTEILHIVNAALDGIKTERWFFYQILRTVFGVTADQRDYTVGDQALGADWYGIERPEKVLGTAILVPGPSGESESEIPIMTVQSYEQYSNIVNKGTRSTIPLVLYYQAGLPVGTATLWPVPRNTVADQVVLYTPQTVQEFTDISADFLVPQGFREFLEFDGAVKVHFRYPKAKSEAEMQKIYEMANDYKARMKAALSTPIYMGSDAAALGRASGLSTAWAFSGRVGTSS